MSVEINYYVHGTSLDNEKEIASGWNQVGLSKKGIEQSIFLGNLINNRKFDVIFSSDLNRAVESAKLVFVNEPRIIYDRRLRECDYGDLTGESMKKVEPLLTMYIDNKFPGGESYKDVESRVGDFLEYLKGNYAGKTVAIMSHQAPQLAMDVLISGKTWDQAFAEDWRKTHSWQAGWRYILE